MTTVQPFEYRTPVVPPYTGVTWLGRFDVEEDGLIILDQLVTPSIAGGQGLIQSVWVDAIDPPRGVTIRNVTSNSRAIWPPGSIGWQPLVCSIDNRLEIASERSGVIYLQVSSALMPFGLSRGARHGSAFSDVDLIAPSLTPVTLLPPNFGRTGYILDRANDTPGDLYVIESDDFNPSLNLFTVKLGPGDYYESQVGDFYVNRVRGVWTALGGQGVMVTEKKL